MVSTTGLVRNWTHSTYTNFTTEVATFCGIQARRALTRAIQFSRMSTKVLLKDLLFNAHSVARLSGRIAAVHSPFSSQAFEQEVLAQFPQLELKARIGCIAQSLRRHLPGEFRAATTILLGSLPAPLDPRRVDDDFGEFILAPLGDFVARYGCMSEHLDFSLQALHQITQRFSAEYAVRPFLKQFPEATLERLLEWTSDPHYHVRRLCCEGSRPKLPWGMAVYLPPRATLPILERLQADPTRFVTRSLANHLNDITKSEPDWVVQTLAGWRGPDLAYIRSHALRGLVKSGHPGALKLLGYDLDNEVEVSGFALQPTRLTPGQTLEFSCQLGAVQECRVVVDYRIHFQSKRGRLESQKVFKLKTLQLSPGHPQRLTKRHPLRPAMTTRQLYPGQHRLELLVNGQIQAEADFYLE